MRLFNRRAATPALPPGTTEEWDGASGTVILALPLDTSRRETHESADALSQALVAAVGAIRSGNIGDAIPAGTENATVRVRIDPSHRDLGELEQRTVEIFAESLGASIPIDVSPGAQPPEDDDDEEEDDPATPAVSLTWDPQRGVVIGGAKLPATNTDLRTTRVLQRSLDALFAAMSDADFRASMASEAARNASYQITFDLADSVVGPRTERLIERIGERFANTLLDVSILRPQPAGTSSS